jgi:hypothetical protein
MFFRGTLAVTAVGGLVALSSCGGDEKSKGSEAKVSNEQAITEVEATRNGLAEALEKSKGGRDEEADNLASEAYLQHFEKVEGPLEEANHDLNEELEESISQEYRAKLKAGDTAGAEDLLAEINRNLTLASGELARK